MKITNDAYTVGYNKGYLDAEDALAGTFDQGYAQGYDEGQAEAEWRYEPQITELNSRVTDLQAQLAAYHTQGRS